MGSSVGMPVCVGIWSSVSERHPSPLPQRAVVRPPLSPPPLSVPSHKGHPSTTRTTTTTTDELLDDNPAPFCSVSLAPSFLSRSSPLPPPSSILLFSSSKSLPVTYLPAYRYRRPTLTVPRHLQSAPLRATYPTVHFLVSPSCPS